MDEKTLGRKESRKETRDARTVKRQDEGHGRSGRCLGRRIARRKNGSEVRINGRTAPPSKKEEQIGSRGKRKAVKGTTTDESLWFGRTGLHGMVERNGWSVERVNGGRQMEEEQVRGNWEYGWMAVRVRGTGDGRKEGRPDRWTQNGKCDWDGRTWGGKAVNRRLKRV
ncbi:hypothetical protein B0H17DRAFT_1131774 [Mycena rosella]|uniref:Uncharacterized protein n=1 Tax=Mycena rosella TaxID=1033263 RepID=A0AAD7DLX4_MYCRO|nr:hypothetical protein B0H17DRAFT_1131774 [Mycena rosella]